MLKIITFLFIVCGLFFRTYNFQNYSYGIDQIQIVDSAKRILSGELTLIGPRTGPAEMFTGPLIYYLATPFVLLFEDKTAMFLLAVSISLITGITLFFLGKKYLSQREGFFLLFLWAFSPFLIHMDRVLWNPSLSVLASSLVFFPLLKKDTDKLDLLLVGTGIFLGYQAHFSGLLLLPIAITTLTLKKHYFAIPVLFIPQILTLLPTALFDLRHGFLNTKGLLGFIFDGKTSTTNISDRFFHKAYIIIETLGKTVVNGVDHQIVMAVGWLAILASLFVLRRKSRYVLVWFTIVATFYSLYKDSTPEYYFLILMPVFFYLLVTLVNAVFSKRENSVVLTK